MWSGEVPARPSASPGLLRRRYSMPETIMRKYRLAQQRSEGEGEDTGRWSATGASSGTRASCAWCGARAGGARREREHMRKSALLRLWGRAGASPARACPCVPCAPCGTRSLDASHSELHTSPRRLRLDTSRDRNSDSSGSPARAASSCTDPIPDVSLHRVESPRRNIPDTRIVRTPVDSPILHIDDRSFTDSSDALTTSMPTMKEIGRKGSESFALLSTSDYIDGRVSERSVSAENEESNIVPYSKPLTLETPYDILEIVVSETLDIRPAAPAIKNVPPQKSPPQIIRNPVLNPQINYKKLPNIDLDEYVSNILVESLNSLTDQLESMNATIGNDRKMSIVEKEIKVKLQNTGVNTIVHLSPTSNNQIIFGNEELYESDNKRDGCNNPRDVCSSNIRESAISIETNNNFTSAESLRIDDASHPTNQPKTESFLNIPSETVNKAVLQQIQKLFQEELHSMEPEINSPDGTMPSISHIEISNVDVFIDNNGGLYSNTDEIEVQTQRNSSEYEVLGGVGAGNYYEENDDSAIVPRFSAFPHTESMEVNTSSSEDAELLGSDCTSLVDSLDDPNSPRSILLRRSISNNKRNELVRSAIDVLDLLPENADKNGSISPKEKGEAFFIRIKDDDCDCEKENIIVADHMPETIKQRLFKRHRKREMRMECARRSKVKQLKRDLEHENLQNQKAMYKSKKEMEKECMLIINALIDDVIAKIAQDEYKCMRISQRSNKLVAAKSDENLIRKHWKKDVENNNNRNARKLGKTVVSHSCSDSLDKEYRKGERLIRGKLSTQAQQTSNSSTDESPPKRIYQKSEIRDGNKCIEILEILEYVNSSQNSDTTNSDENHNLSLRNKKSRIPVPVNEKVQRIQKGSSQRSQKSNGSRITPPILSRERNGKSSQLLASMLLDALEDDDTTHDVPVRRASVPCDSRARSNSLRFKNVFDIIPEERSSLSIESTDDSYNRRASAPSLSEGLHSTDQEERRIRPPDQYRSKESRVPDVRNTGTSPMTDPYRAQVSVGAMTSPIRKSAGTSPIRISSAEARERVQYQPPISHQQQKAKRVTPQRREEEGIPRTLAPILSHRTASTISVE
ncbi:jg14581 [Pararge aegeria aegeria]|uniref:Jg14581 protein n=1 Tax=Pararge aegeria aegeria TaxID=348720 RepID=A0A8S4QYM2_9NEOP|nr:jg14581 [Pararge aegeria aegeria]